MKTWWAIALGNSHGRWMRFEADAARVGGREPVSNADGSASGQIWTALQAAGWQPSETVVVASVVPAALQSLQQQQPAGACLRVLTRDRVPLQCLYSSLGIDRALAVFGAGIRFGFPVLSVDGGTALTLTAVDGDRQLVGGAILPGLGLQGRSLATGTAALPAVRFTADAPLPPRWATDTDRAIHSGILYSVLAGLAEFARDWRSQHPHSPLVLTGGDGATLATGLSAIAPDLAPNLHHDPDALFRGMAATVTANPAAFAIETWQ